MWHGVTKETKYISDDQKTLHELILREKTLAKDYLHFIRKFDQEKKECYNGVQISIDQWNQKNNGEIKWEIRYTAIREAGVKVFIGGYETEDVDKYEIWVNELGIDAICCPS